MMTFLKPYLLWIELVVLALSLSLSGFIGYRLGTSSFKDFQIRAAKNEAVEQLHDSRVAQVVLTKYITQIQYVDRVLSPIIQEVRVEVEKPIYSECIIPDSGRVLLNSAIAQANASITADGSVF